MILRAKRSLNSSKARCEHVELELVALADRGEVLLGRPLAGLDLGVLGAFGLELGDLLLELLEALGELELALLLDRRRCSPSSSASRFGQVGVAPLVVDPGDEVGGEVDDLLELLGLELLTGLGAHEQVGQPRAGAAEVPDVHDRGGQLDVAHALAPDLRAGDLDAAALADDALEPDALVLAAVALPVLGRTEDLLAEEPVLLGLERAVVDGLRLLDLAVRPRADRVGGGQADPKLIEVVDVEHAVPSSSLRLAARRLLRRCPARAGTRSMPSSSAVRKMSSSSSRISISSPVVGEDLDVEAQGLHLLDEHLEALGDAGLGDVLALDDGLVDLHAAEHVVGLDGEQLLQAVGGAVGLEGPHLHLAEALATELRLPAERLLGDHRVRAGRPGVDLVVDEVGQLQDVDVRRP